MRDCLSVDILHNTFQCALNNQKISDGANRDRKYQEVALFRFLDWILDLISGGEHGNVTGQEVIDAKCLLVIDGFNMVTQLLNAQTDSHGNLIGKCSFKVGHEFSITQEHGQLVLSDSKKSFGKKVLTGTTFNQLRAAVLLAYIRETGDRVSYFAHQQQFANVDFKGTSIPTKGLALQLIAADADAQTIFEGYLITQRELGNDNIDIGGFNLEAMDLAHISLADVDLESGIFGQSIVNAALDDATRQLIAETEQQLGNLRIHDPVGCGYSDDAELP